MGGWEFAATGNGYAASDPVYLSFDVGGGLSSQDLQVWHYDGAWTKYAPADLTYDGTNASFTVTSFSGYAVAAPVPEPSSMLLLASALLAALGYGWRRRSK